MIGGIMLDMEREDILRRVHRRLADADFGESLLVVSEDGSKPIVVVTSSDKVEFLIHEVERHGGSANVVTNVLNHILVFGWVNDRNDRNGRGGASVEEGDFIDSSCTVGVLIQRMIFDVDKDLSVTYRIARDGVQRGHADGAHLVSA